MERAHSAGSRTTRRYVAFPALLLLAFATACGRAARAPAPVPGSAASATPVATPVLPPAQPLTWTPHQLPATQPTALPDGSMRWGTTLALAQSDSDTAYACAPAPGAATTVDVWLTHDRGERWSPRSAVVAESGTDIGVDGCTIIVDTLNAGMAVAQLTLLPPHGCAFGPCDYQTYVTFDSGQTWAPLRPPHGPYATLSEFATRQGITYALFSTPFRDASPAQIAFVVSKDHMRTWTPLAGPPLPTSAFNPFQGGYVVSFWLNPFNGGLLTITTSGVFNAEQFWTSSDAGQRWTQMQGPPFPFSIDGILVQQPFAGQPWRICGADSANWYINGQHNTHIHDIACTLDGGATWVTSHLDLPDNVDGIPEYALDAIADDGSVLALLSAGLARFTPGSARLDLLGPIPGITAQQGAVPYAGVLVYAAGQGVGTFWTEPTSTYTGGPPGPVFTATNA